MNILHETLHFTQEISHPVEAVWKAYANVDDRSQWSVPKGEQIIYDASELEEGGRDLYRCGPPEDLSTIGNVAYHIVEPSRRWMYSETLHSGEQLLAVALVTWELEPIDLGTRITIVNQVTSLVGPRMIEGSRNGHNKALDQLAHWLP